MLENDVTRNLTGLAAYLILVKMCMDKDNLINPIFIFSLPRSGSTLLQRLLGSCPEVKTTTEPWLLLPFLYSMRPYGGYAEFGYRNTANAINDFVHELPNGKQDYLDELHDFILRIYKRSSTSDELFFLDKTPRYHLVVDEIIPLFRDGKFIFLWRNPLSVISSIIETWAAGDWNLYRFKIDLYRGLANLVATIRKYEKEVISIRYEDLISEPIKEVSRISDYLGISLEVNVIDEFKRVKLVGRMGDKVGVSTYKNISETSLHKWKTVLCNPMRRAWARRYLKWIGDKRLAVMGYSLEDLLLELDETPMNSKHVVKDTIRMSYGLSYCAFDFRIIKEKLKKIPEWEKIYANT